MLLILKKLALSYPNKKTMSIDQLLLKNLFLDLNWKYSYILKNKNKKKAFNQI